MLRDGVDRTGLRSRMLKVGLDRCHISEISMAELASGASKMASERGYFELSFVRTILDAVPFGGMHSKSSEIFGNIKSDLEKKGTPLEDMDILIAATAIDRNYILVAHNTSHFKRIPGLKIEDWLSA